MDHMTKRTMLPHSQTCMLCKHMCALLFLFIFDCPPSKDVIGKVAGAEEYNTQSSPEER